MNKLDIDKILDDVFEMGVNHGKGLWNDYPALKQEAKQAIFNRIAAEAVPMGEWNSVDSRPVQAIPLSKLKAIMEIKDENS